MLTKRSIKFVKSLQLKKYRKQENAFVVEGEKGVLEALSSDYKIKMLIGTESFFENQTFENRCKDVYVESQKVLESISSFESNKSALAVIEMPAKKTLLLEDGELGLILDNIQDPGNLGTIIRTADWYGIKKIVCSEDTVDLYNPKVINSTMGSFTRVDLLYTDICSFVNDTDRHVCGAFLEGDSIYDFGKEKKSRWLVMGNESQGISNAVASLIKQKIHIPGAEGAESLNVAIATAVICDNWLRNQN